jgi:hypothetical protein
VWQLKVSTPQSLLRQEEQEALQRQRQERKLRLYAISSLRNKPNTVLVEREATRREQQHRRTSKRRGQRQEDDIGRNEEMDWARNRQLAGQNLKAALGFLDQNFRSKESESAENQWCQPVPDAVKASSILSFWKETQTEDLLPLHFCVFCQLKHSRSFLLLQDWRRLIPAELAATLYPRTQCASCFPTEEEFQSQEVGRNASSTPRRSLCHPSNISVPGIQHRRPQHKRPSCCRSGVIKSICQSL